MSTDDKKKAQEVEMKNLIKEYEAFSKLRTAMEKMGDTARGIGSALKGAQILPKGEEPVGKMRGRGYTKTPFDAKYRKKRKKARKVAQASRRMNARK